jgi:hypothetical protein
MRSLVLSWKMECMMPLKFASAAIVLGCLSMLSACDTEQVAAPANPSAVVAIGDASATLIAATTNPCKLNPGDPFWRQHGGQQGYEQRCGHLQPD